MRHNTASTKLHTHKLPFRHLATMLIAAAILSSSGRALSDNTPITLTDTELDTISAGYVLMTLTSNATASGENAIVITVTESNTNSRRGRRGGTRTVSNGTALAEAMGDIVLTETGYVLDTDEQILSLRAVQRITNSEDGTTVVRIRVNRSGRVTVRTRTRPANGRNAGPVVIETNTLNVRVVTRGNRR